MPLQKLQLRPGLNREGTNYSNEGGYYDGDKIRFRSGFPEKLGGWARLSSEYFLGIARSMWNWSTLAGLNLLGVGTNLKYYIEQGGYYNDITPIIGTSTYNNTIATGFTTLVANITSNSTTFELTDGSYFPQNSGLVRINSEDIFYAALSTANVATGVIRGFNNTTAATHLAGANVASAYLRFNDTDNDASDGQFVIISGSTAVDGIPANVINQEHQVNKYASGPYFILASIDSTYANASFANASVTAGGGNAISVQYEVPSGLEVYSIGTGWGAGPWSRGGWGSAYDTGVGVGQQLQLWSNDNYGQDLIFAPRGGEIYYWEAANGVGTRGKLLSDLAGVVLGPYVPVATNQVIASAIQRFVICYGANSYINLEPATDFDPMLVRWSDQEDPYNWIPEVTNQSGEFRLSNGSYIMCARATRQEILVWTDSAIYSQQYLGPPYVWGFNLLMDNISIMAPNAAITVNNVTYWMGTDKFYMYSGRVETLPCALRQYVFADINKDQAWQVTCGTNEGYNEIWWFYCSKNSNVVDTYVVYNYLDRVWYYGSLQRTAWLDSGIRQNPMGAYQFGRSDEGNPLGRILYHEIGNDDASELTPVAIEAYVQSSDFDIGDGHNFGFIWRILPDVNFNGSNVNQPAVTMELQPRYNSGSAYGDSDVPTVTSSNNYTQFPQYTVQQFTGQVYTRLRARQMAFRISSNGLGVAWQLGSPRIDIKNDGRR
jgi:hypothetical protein